MGLQSLIGDVTSTVGNGITSALETAWGVQLLELLLV